MCNHRTRACVAVRTSTESLVVTCLRHGESVANVGLATTDPLSIGLTPRGLEQARAAADSIHEAPHLFVSSGATRAILTAAPSCRKFPNTPHTVWEIQEFTYLDPSGCVGTTIEQRRPLVQEYWARSDVDARDSAGAESFRSFIDRVRRMFRRLAQVRAEGGRTVVVFGHGQFFQAAAWLVRAQPFEIDGAQMRAFRAIDMDSMIGNAQGIRFLLHGGRWSVVGCVDAVI